MKEGVAEAISAANYPMDVKQLSFNNKLNRLLNQAALNENGVTYTKESVYRDFRAGDVRHSQASIEKIKSLLGYKPEFVIGQGIDHAMPWYIDFQKI